MDTKLPRHDLESMQRIANETDDGHASDALIDAICEIERLTRDLEQANAQFRELLFTNGSIAERNLRLSVDNERRHAALSEAGRQVYGGGWIDHSGQCEAGLEGRTCTCGLTAWLKKYAADLMLSFPSFEAAPPDSADGHTT